MALSHAQIDEVNVNVSCSQKCCWNPCTGITGKIKLFSGPYISVVRYDLLNAVGIIVLSKPIS
jgi:hypothetical protein